MNSYELSRQFYDWAFENPEKVKPNHAALYFFAIEHCNRLAWKEKFGFPTTMAMDAIGIKSYNTYIKTLNDLVEFGFIKMIERSKNQYSSNIISLFGLSENNKAPDKALDKALIKHGTKQSESTVQSIDSIIKQINNKQYNNKQLTKLKNCIDVKLITEKEIKNDFVEKEFEDVFNDWLEYKKDRKESYKTQKSLKACYNNLKKLSGNSPSVAMLIVEQSIANNYAGLFELKQQVVADVPNIDYDKLIETWDKYRNNLSRISEITGSRKTAVDFIVAKYGKDRLVHVFKKVSESKDLQNANWNCSFDWVIKLDNFLRIYEGNYDNKQQIIPKASGLALWGEEREV